MKKAIGMAIAAAALSAPSAFAQSMFDSQRTDRTWGHVGVSGGQSKFRTDCSSLFDCDKKDTAW